MTKPLYIFDIDGTCSLVDHRRHYVTNPGCSVCKRTSNVVLFMLPCSHCNDTGRNPGWKPNWTAFYDDCDLDDPNVPVLTVLNHLYNHGNEIWFFSGRVERIRDKTVNWLHANTELFIDELINGQISLRADGDTRPDDIVKKEFLDAMLPEDRERLVAVFDDRDRVVAMWRANGIACFQVAPGDF